MIKLKKKIAIVNVLFPPKALGGATRIVADQVSLLNSLYGDQFDVVVFTSDVEKRPVYELEVYPYNGIRVYSISAHVNNWVYQDSRVAEIFDEFLEFEKPDLVHFHCVQILTGSIVEVTQNRSIPHLITVHDAWWISDFQFLIDSSDRVYPNGHSDPFEKITPPDGITFDQSISRRSYLKSLLAKSNGVLAVSDTYRKIYEKNGVANILTNKNGISNDIAWGLKNTKNIENIVCAHIGGMSAHKGYEIFKGAVQRLKGSNIEVLIVDHTKPKDYHSQTRWGNSTVNIIGLVTQSNIQELYQRIDVLFAPSTCPESYGLVTREAAACGCWLVGSNVGAIREDISIDNGFVVTPTEANLFQILQEIDHLPQKYKGFSKSSPTRYSSDQVVELIEIINKVLEDSNYQSEQLLCA